MSRPFKLLATVVAGLATLVAYRLWSAYRPGDGTIQSRLASREDHTTVDSTGRVRSTQAALLSMPETQLADIWTPTSLERLARTYWAFLGRVFLDLVRVEYTEDERRVVAVHPSIVLLRFYAPEYAMNAERGIVRWRIKSGVLVAGRGKDAGGYLQIDVEKRPSPSPGRSELHVAVEVANFYPMLGSIWLPLYKVTQSAMHVLVTHGFLRSLAQGALEESFVGRFAPGIDEVPDPPPSGVASPA